MENVNEVKQDNMDDETYELEVMEYDYIDDCSKESFMLSLNIIKNNRAGGRKYVEY